MTLELAIQWAFGAPGRIQQNEWELRTFLNKVMAELSPHRTVELGSWRGTTAALLSWVTSIVTVSVDTTDYGGKEEAIAHAKELGPIYWIGDARQRKTMEHMYLLMGAKVADLIFLDDGHRIEEVTEEYILWQPCIRSGGWMVFHDINPDANKLADGTHPDICMAHEFWANLKGNKEEIIFRGNPPGPGIGILRV